MPLGLHERLRIAAEGRSNRMIADLTGVPTETVRRYMRGQGPSAEFLTRFCGAMGISGDWLLMGRGPMRAANRIEPSSELDDVDDMALSRMADQVESLRRRLDRLERRARSIARPIAQQNGRAFAG